MDREGLKQFIRSILKQVEYNPDLYSIEGTIETINHRVDQLEPDLYKIPYNTLEEHLKTRKEEAEEYLKWCN